METVKSLLLNWIDEIIFKINCDGWMESLNIIEYVEYVMWRIFNQKINSEI